MSTKKEISPEQPAPLPFFIWELDEVRRAILRQQRESTPYPSQMNGLIDSYESYLADEEKTNPEQQGGSHA